MRTILSTIAVVCMVFSLQANDLRIPNKNLMNDLATKAVDNNLNLLKIKTGEGGHYYSMTGSLTILQAPAKGRTIINALDASFRNEVVVVYRDRDYIQANAKAKRNDNQQDNEVRFYVHHDNRGQGKVDKNKVKVNWKSGKTGEIAGNLSNVVVLYNKESILITGTLKKNGYTIGVSLAISNSGKLI